MEIDNCDFTNDFLSIAKIMVERSDGKLRLAFKEKSDSIHLDREACHFLKLDGKRICEDIEHFGNISKKDKLGYGLPDFLMVLFNIRRDCPESYTEGARLLKEIGDKIFKDKILENWNLIFERNS